MVDLKLVVNGKEFSTLNDVPEGLRRLVAQTLAEMKLTPEQLRGQRRIVVQISRQAIQRQGASNRALPEDEDDVDAPSRPDSAPVYRAPRYERPRSFDTAGDGPLLGPGDPSPFSKHLLALVAASLAAWAFYNSFAR